MNLIKKLKNLFRDDFEEENKIRQERDGLKALLQEYLTLEGGEEINAWHDKIVKLLNG